MANNRDRAFDTRDDGILIENGAWFSSGVAAPIHTANNGDIYLRTGSGTEEFYRYEGGSWVLKKFDDNSVKVTSNDTTPDFLKNKLTTTDDGVHEFIEINDGGNETLEYVRYFGQSPTFSKNDPLASTTSSTYQQRLRLTLSSTVNSAVYLVMCNANVRNTNVGGAVQVRLQSDDTITHGEAKYYSGDSGGSNWFDDFIQFTCVDWFDGDGTSMDFDLDYRAQHGGTAYIQDARIIIWRLTKT